MKARYTQPTGDTPHYTHDCDVCRFLGRFLDHDCYVCMEGKPDSESLIMRWSSEPSEYRSMDLSTLKRMYDQMGAGESILRRGYQHFFVTEVPDSAPSPKICFRCGATSFGGKYCPNGCGRV